MSASASGAVYGTGVTFTATVSNTSTAIVPSGVVQFFDDSASPALLIGTASLSGGDATFATSTLSAGSTHDISAMYVGSGNFTTSTTSPSTANLAVTAATTTITVTEPASSLIYGQPITVQATATNTSGTGSIPTGVVEFWNESASPPELLGEAPLENGVATTSPPVVLGAGNNNIATVYNGLTGFVNANYLGSTSTTSPTVSVTPATTTTTMTESATSLMYGQLITFQATVKNASGTGSIPTGVVQFFNESTSTPTLLGQTTLASGVATTMPLALPAGTYNIAAVYNGQAGSVNSNYSGSTSPTAPTVNVTSGTTTTTMTQSATSLSYGQSITLKATVNNTSGTGPIPTGVVQFWNESASPPKLLGRANLASGVATTTLVPGAGSYNIAAVYDGPAGTTSGAESTSPISPTVTVTRAATATTMTEPASSQIYGQSITLRATVNNTSGTGPIPTGVVQFFNQATSPPTLLGRASLTSGVATTTLVPGAGSYNLAAVYNGLPASANANFTESSSPTSPPVTVTPATTTTTMTESATSLIYGQPLTLKATVNNTSGTGAIPTGVVQFWNESASPPEPLGQANLAGGVANSTLVPGRDSYKIAAVYQRPGRHDERQLP